ncbi:1-(5-phosphoribosyl)-5-[(5-phosphoribosylamino)methylideneamino]imidazole-4-carboxamide isomerase [Phaeocystidibacter marisrubri]|uniref:1-(5-phosphoribosyl)-5-[(5-phosphoribosylamino)methylideneamino] imidazole-4-carboxamide isomerase n=1 Tax=Phaeocystidibacter marisrubri TaxID=1577780 RepID=A0A6L3ZDK1_9FLAO|nr:1-(5-phosphoribosyl)-5-[(5-phosphoribosylamino)methylideneamino]imidazole-4-carboxamide isomerase [Phaeocystidibacter marisrubri]KAB2815750.1 1-(5-phosphoribosyl)-5-[(5-phosphoribosylamino)methylideneamino]imidazole-4-carboxamide isomerase [Phaeocystidibacter marisrubri]GGH65518.1 1-(5-phosphoribosyl)-5-[(5-phosphoribosylamino) methylideneamino] imidazole-4-carboxamide isomerase [Phaeocystidibacter marisrubri]
MKIIPAIDILNGKCVRLTQGDYGKPTVYNQSPLEVALELEANGIQHVHVVDLDGAASQKIVNQRTLEQIATRTRLIVDFGGGIKSDADIQIALNSGATQVTLGSIAALDRETTLRWLEHYGPSKMILGADFKNGRIATSGWNETSSLELLPFILDYENEGIQSCICTDISKDGMMAGPSMDIYAKILQQTNVDLIASGGISSLSDIMALSNLGCFGAIVGKALYEGKIRLKDLRELC